MLTVRVLPLFSRNSPDHPRPGATSEGPQKMDQDQALALMKTGASVFLTGEPGSGKTHTVNRYVKYLRGAGVSPAITASTGIAATHIGGTTVHSWSGIGIRKELSSKELKNFFRRHGHRKRLRETGVLIIDEISMLDAATLDLVSTVCKRANNSAWPFGGMQVILVGDFFQLPPVSRAGEPAEFAFRSPAWAELDPRVLYLTEQHRQEDADFLSLLQAIRAGAFEETHFERLKSRRVGGGQVSSGGGGAHPGSDHGAIPDGVTKLFCHNANVDAVNSRELARLPGEESHFQMTSWGEAARVEKLRSSCTSPETLTLKAGALVMFTRNDFEAGYVNGTLGKVTGFDADDGLPLVRTAAGKSFKAEPHDWSIENNDEVVATVTQVPLRLAWAITVHKSQGMSLDAAVIDLSRVFECGQGYVALSRVRSLSGLHLLGMNPRAMMVHPEVAEADTEFRACSERLAELLARTPQAELKEQWERFIEGIGGER
ncbi:MAG: ATP-dependent DNA helicase [Thermoleophilia bacterium]